MMIKTLQKHGNSQALVLDKPIIDALGINSDTPLQLTISGSSLIISPANVGIGQNRIAESLDKLRPRYGEMLKNLAK
jgi:antitoxin component of MazEF toxin-antitoxin module